VPADDNPHRLIRTVEGWTPKRADGAGPFTSRLVWDLPDGGEATWESRSARKRGAVKVRSAPGEAAKTLRAAPEIARRLVRVNWVAATAFTIGGSLFAVGAWVAQLGSGKASTAAVVYFIGGIFFTTGGYASLLGAINAPRSVDADGSLAGERWRWWSYEPTRIDWLGTFVLFAGTIAFGVSLADSFIQGLSGPQINRLIWTPEMFGCILFLVSGHLGFVEICHRPYPCWRPRDLGWAIVAINQVGSVFFMISALAGLIRPATGSAVSLDVANWGTLIGAACFAIGGVMQAFDRPASPEP
jgi:hypothetical protein